MTGRLLILGYGGHGRVVADAAFECGYEEIAFLDDAEPAVHESGCRLLGPFSAAGELAVTWPSAIVAIGNGSLRLELFETLRGLSFQLPSIVHPSAIVSRNAFIGDGVFVAAGAIVNTGARIGDAAIINTGARIDHDCQIGAGSHIAPGATLSGDVITGLRTWIGTGCAVRQGVKIGDDTLVGIGAAIVSDLGARGVYAGVPARLIRKI